MLSINVFKPNLTHIQLQDKLTTPNGDQAKAHASPLGCLLRTRVYQTHAHRKHLLQAKL